MVKMVFAVVMICLWADVWGQSYCKRWYRFNGNSVGAYAIAPAADGNFMVAGCSTGPSIDSIYLLKITSIGDTLWTKTIGSSQPEGSNAIAPAGDGNFIVAGYRSKDVLILKISSHGDTLWTRTYGGPENDFATAIALATDGNFIIAATTASIRYEDRAVYLIKITPSGDTLWTRTYSRSVENIAYGIAPLPGGNSIIAGYVHPCGDVTVGAYFCKIAPNGDTLWTKTYPGSVAYSIVPSLDGNFIAAGYTQSMNGNSEVYIMKVSSNGDMLSAKIYGGNVNYWPHALTPTSDGKILLVGTRGNSGSPYEYCTYLMKITREGDTLWTKVLPGTGGGASYGIATTRAGDFIVTGPTDNNGKMLLLSIINDRYAKKDSLVYFKIPVSGDSLGYTYFSLESPSGMTVSNGGTIAWIPKTDSIYMEHAAFSVTNGQGVNDTLTFNIFVNASDKRSATKPPLRRTFFKKNDLSFIRTPMSQMKFQMQSDARYIDIFDFAGRFVQRLAPMGGQVLWEGMSATGVPVPPGRYFARIKGKMTEGFRSLSVIR
jgi:hypothetical protein